MPQYPEYLAELREEQSALGILPQDGCDREQIEAFVELVSQQLDIQPPTDYLEFLQLSNGFADNGTVIYAIDEINPEDQVLPTFISENLKREFYPTTDQQNPWFAIGHSDYWIYAYTPSDSSYQLIDLTSGDIVHQFATFDELLVTAIKECMGDLLEDEAYE